MRFNDIIDLTSDGDNMTMTLSLVNVGEEVHPSKVVRGQKVLSLESKGYYAIFVDFILSKSELLTRIKAWWFDGTQWSQNETSTGINLAWLLNEYRNNNYIDFIIDIDAIRDKYKYASLTKFGLRSVTPPDSASRDDDQPAFEGQPRPY